MLSRALPVRNSEIVEEWWASGGSKSRPVLCTQGIAFCVRIMAWHFVIYQAIDLVDLLQMKYL